MILTRRNALSGLAALAPTAYALADTPNSDPKLDRAARAALRKLVSDNPAARALNDRALGVLVFPRIVKVGFLLGGSYGEGGLLKEGRTAGYYNSAAASYGLQAGLQRFGYALFFMNDAALQYLGKSSGFEIGVGPSVAVIDRGLARKFSSTTLTQDIYAFIFGQNGLMAGIGIEGAKITKVG